MGPRSQPSTRARLFPRGERTAVALKRTRRHVVYEFEVGTTRIQLGSNDLQRDERDNTLRDKARMELASVHGESRDGCIGSDDSSLGRPVVA